MPTSDMIVYGPHCSHSECSWLWCDLGEGDEYGVVFPCHKRTEGLGGCPSCGPNRSALSLSDAAAQGEMGSGRIR